MNLKLKTSSCVSFKLIKLFFIRVFKSACLASDWLLMLVSFQMSSIHHSLGSARPTVHICNHLESNKRWPNATHLIYAFLIHSRLAIQPTNHSLQPYMIGVYTSGIDIYAFIHRREFLLCIRRHLCQFTTTKYHFDRLFGLVRFLYLMGYQPL